MTLPDITVAHPSPLSTLLPDEDDLVYIQSMPEGWALHTHPQGWIYFTNEKLRVVLDQDVRTIEGYEAVQRSIREYDPARLGEDMEVLLHVQNSDSKGINYVCLFSLAVNHRHCVASYTLEHVTEPNVQYLSPKSQNQYRRLYWNYLYNHPTHVLTPPIALRECADALTWYYTDNMISGLKSTAPFSKTECDELSALLKDFTQPYHEGSVSRTLFLAWVLREVCRYRDAESYGVHTFKESLAVRQNRRNAMRPPASLDQTNPTAFVLVNLVIKFLFFGIPRTYWVHIKTTSEFRGRLAAVQQNWDNYIARLVREYSHFLLISTVLLSATVGFLSIDDITEGARLGATASALTSLSSIIIGVFSIWRHQANTSTKHSYTYMHNVQHGTFGIPGHAILLSLPPVLLVWAIIAFTVAILMYVAEGVTRADDHWSRLSAAALLGIFGILFSAVVLALWTFSIIWTFQSRAGPMLGMGWENPLPRMRRATFALLGIGVKRRREDKECSRDAV